MHERRRELTLHKVVAGSAFLFALCLLPVAQYLLFDYPGKVIPTASIEGGTVAGVSTDQSITATSTPRTLGDQQEIACADRDKQLEAIDAWMVSRRLSVEKTYEEAVKPYRDALGQLQGTPDQIASEQTALNSLITNARPAYDQKIADAQRAVDSQKLSLTSAPCLAE